MIIADNITFNYHKNKSFGPINLQLEAGKVHVLIGENGAGKSTFIQLLLNELKAKTGHIQIDLNINYMPDDLNFPPYLKVQEIIQQLAQLKATDVGQILEEVGLFDNRNMYVKSLSKGMRQRLNLAQAMLTDNPIIIMDEPTNGLDPLWIFKLEEMILSRKNDNTTMLITTHQLDFAQNIADHIYVMRDGKITHDSENRFDNVDELIALYKKDWSK